ncbi:MAG: HAD hydrolase-like protein [Candidatus Bathyarchaeota archaeon]|nr:HAD hydrolase-like protein [Candidatus Bathyarchaeota archaeon]
MASSVKIVAVALDFDGVIANLEVDWNEVIRKISKTAGQDIKSLLTFYEANFGVPIYQKVSAEIENIELEALKNTQLVPFIGEFLKSLQEKQMPVYVVSMQTAKVIQVYLNQQGLSSYIKEVVTRDRFPSKRAQVDYVTKTAGGRVLFVDDLKRNLISCQGLNVECFHFQRTKKPKDAQKSWDKILELIK